MAKDLHLSEIVDIDGLFLCALTRVEWLHTNAQVLEASMDPPADLDLSTKARQCSNEAASELKMLRCMERQTISTLHGMMGALSKGESGIIPTLFVIAQKSMIG